MDPLATIHPPKYPLCTCTTAFPLTSFFLAQKTHKSCFFCFKKMKNKKATSLAYLLPIAYQFLFLDQ